MTTRDLLVLMLLIVSSVTVGAVDAMIDLNPEGNDGVLTAGLVFAISWFAYRIGKAPKK